MQSYCGIIYYLSIIPCCEHIASLKCTFFKGRKAVEMKAQQWAKKNEPSVLQSQKASFQNTSPSVLHRLLSPAEARSVAPERKPQLKPRVQARQRTPSISEEMTDDVLYREVEKLESSMSSGSSFAYLLNHYNEILILYSI